jgi:hypothetical protein
VRKVADGVSGRESQLALKYRVLRATRRRAGRDGNGESGERSESHSDVLGGRDPSNSVERTHVPRRRQPRHSRPVATLDVRVSSGRGFGLPPWPCTALGPHA